MSGHLARLAVILISLVAATTHAEAKRGIPLFLPRFGEEDGISPLVSWGVIILIVVAVIAWKLVRRGAKAAANVYTESASSLSQSAGSLARTVSEARSASDGAWADKVAAKMEARSTELTAAAAKPSERLHHAPAFKPVRNAANAAPRASFGRR